MAEQQAYEYSTVVLKLDADLNGLGRDGWKLVTVVTIEQSASALFYFMRNIGQSRGAG